jgi:hypothetical protein
MPGAIKRSLSRLLIRANDPTPSFGTACRVHDAGKMGLSSFEN